MKMDKNVPCFWLSFNKVNVKNEPEFVGVIILFATSPISALKKSHALGINPGGEAIVAIIGPGIYSKIPKSDFNRLLDKAYLISSDLGEATTREMALSEAICH